MHIQPHDHTGAATVAYVLNSKFSKEGVAAISKLHQEISKYFGELAWLLPSQSLHVTLMDWIAPFVQYGEDPDILFKKHGERYISVLEDIVKKEGPISVHFNQINISPTTIFIQGTDDGAYQRIRESFLMKAELLPGTKQPPSIIHASIARFVGVADFPEAEDFIATVPVDFEENIDEFRLVRETILPMQGYEILRTLPLRSKI
ncbi:2'-5' RNA ligase family protein [Candidatus Parcubacteria bacterium]|uniref:DUF1868 domain-containing protein n=1 Tax=Candidatus Kaiserbacteria bacterium CG10_big_fil_rev_8_21_14_0_10_47_16 TaxID=1974608 RepID=A0A2H0UEE8_9BACT|nr:2'-5' RNA ligase family protein [Candidatus Parcubacteria bacterium]PIR84730.1 MAG: hypothetical protein COU16_00905 [Candidatus Kaiserbacteria bacterium CG10_big_fil_rev_8_21_14_0_10_47_16]